MSEFVFEIPKLLFLIYLASTLLFFLTCRILVLEMNVLVCARDMTLFPWKTSYQSLTRLL